MAVDQQKMSELTEELARLSTQRKEAEKENLTLRREIMRLMEIVNKIKPSSGCEGGSKVDSYMQTDEIIFPENRGNRSNQNMIDPATRAENFERHNLSRNDNEFNFNKNRESGDYINKSGIGSEGCRGDNRDPLMSLMSYFQSLQVMIPLPKFDGIKRNPIEFIKQLEKYFLRKNTSEELKLILIEDALVGRAKLWHDARIFPFISYVHFEEKFLEEFYSIEALMVAKIPMGKSPI